MYRSGVNIIDVCNPVLHKKLSRFISWAKIRAALINGQAFNETMMLRIRVTAAEFENGGLIYFEANLEKW